MEDDDEFGDLYADVLRPLTTSFQAQLPQSREEEEEAALKVAGAPTRPIIDLNINSDDDEILYGAPNANSRPNFTAPDNIIGQGKTLDFSQDKPSGFGLPKFNLNLNHEAGKIEGLIDIDESNTRARVLENNEVVDLGKRGFQDSNFMDDADIDFVVEVGDDKDDVLMEKDQHVGGNIENPIAERGNEGSFETEDVRVEPMIPGVSIPGVSGGTANVEDDWDSDSEDDLQIVLNDNTHGPMGMELMGDGEDDDEDGEPLVIVANDDGPSHPPMMEEQEWGEEGGPVADGERKEIGDALKVNGATGIAAKVGYVNHGYHHPYHSQYKYVRPGAAPPVGVGGTPGQVRPPVNLGPVAGRGRGDWRPTGMKGFHGMPGWGGTASGRGFGIGLEFTLPSHKTIFEVDIDGFEEKPWRLPGIDVAYFFNFDLNEESWKGYCKQLEQLRLGSTMPGRIRVYESGRTDQNYDPDLPPELAAAAGIQDIPSENVKHGKTDTSSNDLMRGSAHMRPPLPTGRAIQVEIGSGDRLPSIDTRPPRQRDSDAIIEIVCQDSADGDLYTGNDENEGKLGNDPSREDFSGDATEGFLQEDVQDFEGFQHSYNSHKQEFIGRRTKFMNPVDDHLTRGDGLVPFTPKAPGQFMDTVANSGKQTSVNPRRNYVVRHEERGKKGRVRDRSPDMTPREGSRDNLLVANQKEDSFESVDGRHHPVPPPTTDRPAGEQDMEHKDDIHNEFVGADTNSEVEEEKMDLDARIDSDTMKDEILHSAKKQKISSQLEQPSPQETDGGEDSKAARSSENSKVRSGSSKDYRKLQEDVEEEVVPDERPTHMDNAKKAVSGDADRVRKKSRDEKEAEKHHAVVKGREDSYSRKGIDTSSAHHIERRGERKYSEGVRQRRDEDVHGRRTKVEGSRERELIDEIGSRHRSKVREFDGSDREERHVFRKQLENGTLRPDYGQDMGARHRDRDELKRYDNLDHRHDKRNKEETKLSREHAADKETIVHSHGESIVRRKRERDDASDQRKRDEPMRRREDEQHYIRHKENGLFPRERSDRQREREEWHRLKQSQEEALSKGEEGRGGAGRAAEEKAWAGHSRGKDEYKSSAHHPKDVRHSDLVKRRDHLENGSPLRLRAREDARGRLPSNVERQARHERVSIRENHVPHASHNSRVSEKRIKENLRKGKESEGDHNSQLISNMNEDVVNGQTNELVSSKRKFEHGSNENQIDVNRKSSTKHREDASSDDEQQDSRRGRSKLERWTSHKERDFNIGAKSSSVLKMKDIDVQKSSGTSLSNKRPDEALKKFDDNQQPAANGKNGGGSEINNVEKKHVDDKHLETVEKLKKRSERFKLPMPTDKEATIGKNIEVDPLVSAQIEIHPESEVKPERPPRKRRWTGN